MSERQTAKVKIFNEYKDVLWAIGYWQRRLELSVSLDETKYCREGLERNEKLKPGLEKALSLMGVSHDSYLTCELMSEGVSSANNHHQLNA